VKLGLLERLLAAGGEGGAALATDLATGAQSLVTASSAEGDLELGEELLAEVRRAIAGDRSATVEHDSRSIFVEVWNPRLRLIIVGAVHTAQVLAPLARLAGYAVTVIDPRTAFGTAARFPDTDLRHEWPDPALSRLKPNRRTAVVTLTHDAKIDDPALQAALASEAFYIGALGSRRTHAKRVERLAAAGLGAAMIGRIRGPVGLAIGALTPGEIAVSIMAEMTAVLRGAPLAQRSA